MSTDGGTGIVRTADRFIRQHGVLVGGSGIVIAALLPFVFTRSIIFAFSLMFLYAAVGYAAVISIGYGGQLILSFGAFLGIGAYTFVKLVGVGLPTWIAVPVGGIATTAVAYVLGVVAIRTTGIYLGIITLTFNEAFVVALQRFRGISGGTKGIPSPDLAFPGLAGTVPYEVLYYWVTIGFFAVTFVVFHRILSSDIGRKLVAIQNDRQAAESLGINTRRYRLFTFTAAGTVCGVGGAILAPLTGYVSPSTFDLTATAQVILAPVIGGIQAPAWVILGSFVANVIPEFLRVIGNVRLLLYGLILVLLLIFLPMGVGGWVRRRILDRR